MGQWKLSWVILTTLYLHTVTGEDEATHNITISCPETDKGEHCRSIKHPTEYELELHCHLHVTQKVAYIRWLHHNGSDINDLDGSRMHYDGTNTSSTLRITSLTLDDTGNYTCVTSLPSLWSYVSLEAYVMPDYFIAGMVLLGLNLGLCVLFFACLSHSIYKQYKMVRAHENRLFQPIDGMEKEVISGLDLNKC